MGVLARRRLGADQGHAINQNDNTTAESLLQPEETRPEENIHRGLVQETIDRCVVGENTAYSGNDVPEVAGADSVEDVDLASSSADCEDTCVLVLNFGGCASECAANSSANCWSEPNSGPDSASRRVTANWKDNIEY